MPKKKTITESEFRSFADYCVYIAEYLAKVNPLMIVETAKVLRSSSTANIFIIGNGGSAANASHFANDLVKICKLRALSLTDNVAVMTAYANDEGYETIFEAQLERYGVPGDILIAISGSGNSPNILRAVRWAKQNDVAVIAFTGFDGGELKPMADIAVHVPMNDMCSTETIHSLIMHYLALKIRDEMSKK